MERQLNLHRSRYPTLVVDIQINELSDGRLRVLGRAINPEDNTEYAEINAFRTSPVQNNRKNSAITEAKETLERRFYEVYRNGLLDEQAIRDAFQKVKEGVESGEWLRPSWKSASTNKSVMLYFERNTLEIIIPYLINNRMFLDSDRNEIYQQIYEKCYRSCGNRVDAAHEAAVKNLKNADIVLAHMRDVDDRIPNISLTPEGFCPREHRNEQVKMLPYAVLTKFYQALTDLVKTNPRLAFFGILVVYGMRPAEAAGCTPADIMWSESYCVVQLRFKELDGKLSSRLKNKYSVRPVIISYWGTCLLCSCSELIGDSYPKNGDAMNISSECAQEIKRMLLDAGAAEAVLKSLAEDLTDEDLDDTSKLPEESRSDYAKKIGCYVLRRCYTTIARSMMGLSLYETDRLLGHIPVGANGKQSKRTGADLNSPETQSRIAERMERYVFLPDYSLNPAYKPYSTSSNTRFSIIEYSEYNFVNDSDSSVTLELNLETSEAGEDIKFYMPVQPENALTAISIFKDWKGVSRTVIANSSQFK